MHEYSDKELVDLFRTKSDEAALNELFHRYYSKIRQLVSYKIAKTDVDDLVQDIFVKIFTSIYQLQDPNKLESWITQIVHNQINDYYRKSYRQKELESKILLDTIIISDSTEDVTMEKFELSDIYDIILGFPSNRTRAFLLRHLNGMSYEEIAATTAEKHSTVRGKIARIKDNIIDEIFNRETPKEVRERISTKLSQLASTGKYLEQHLKNDYFQNQELLEAINPARTAITTPRIYFYESLDNVMILSDICTNIQTCLIKVKSKTAIPVLLNRISTTKKLHCIFLSTEYIADAKKYLKYNSTETVSYSFVAKPPSNIEILSKIPITEITLANTEKLDDLKKHDPKLSNLIDVLVQEYGNECYKYKFFIANDNVSTKISAYAFFIQVDNHLWTLAEYRSFDKSSNTIIKQCITVGTHELLNQGYYISNSGIPKNDRLFIEIAPKLGFEVVCHFISGSVIIK